MTAERKRVLALLGAAFVVSIVHYVDNTANYAAFPQSATLPDPPRWLVAFGWFFFTAFGVAGVSNYLRERWSPAAICLAVYSGSGLVGLGHYTVPGTGSFPWWRHAHIVSDIALGVAIFVLALRLAGRARAESPAVRAPT